MNKKIHLQQYLTKSLHVFNGLNMLYHLNMWHLFNLETPVDLLAPDLVKITFREMFHSLVYVAASRWNIPFVDIPFNKREWKSGNDR